MKLSLEQVVGQQFLLSFEGRTHPPEAFLDILKKQHVGGVVLFRHKNMSSLEELRGLTRELQAAAAEAGRPPLLIAVDQEGGQLMAMGQTTPFPGNMIALEGALKLKEVSYIHAEGYPSGELKHGPTALVSEDLPVVVLATRDKHDPSSMLLYEKSISSLHEFVQREIPVIAIATEGDEEIPRLTSGVVFVPEVPALLQPIIEVVPLQFLAYHIAVLCGRNVDRPRHLSKSVVVE